MIGERIKELRHDLKLSQLELGDKIGVNPSAISQMESNKINPALDTMIQLSHHYGVNLHWLITGVGSMYEVTGDMEGSTERRLGKIRDYLHKELDTLIRTKQEAALYGSIELPVAGEIPAGPPAESVDSSLEILAVNRGMIEGEPAEYVCLRVNGHSMEPLVMHNDLVLIRQTQKWDKLNGSICALRIDGAITLKRLSLDPRSKLIVLLSINDEYQPILVNPQEHRDIVLIGSLRFLYRKLQ
ncbi:MAG TPA: XRE family transcriptional regulator [Candidatus Syntrophosphaera sp.]|nr:XRE family transcriptional regulator [Candidatus Syntrophosphaera sp.]